jgi:hypothetical protein
VTEETREDIEDPPFHGAGDSHPEKDQHRWLGFEGMRETHGTGRKAEKK